jgi:long-chain acyl-CoA synthetase
LAKVDNVYIVVIDVAHEWDQQNLAKEFGMTSFLAQTLIAVMHIKPTANAVEHDERWWTWADLDRRRRSIWDRFQEAEVGHGARIGILFRSRPAHLSALLACTIHDRCAVAFNTLLPPERLLEDLRQQEVALLLGEAADIARPEVRLAIEEVAIPAVSFERLPEHGAIWASRRRHPSPQARQRCQPGVLIEMLTSGTTGTPKRIPLGVANFEESLRSANAYERGRHESDRPTLRSGVRIITAPLTHISGISVALMSLASGRKICLIEKFAVEPWVAAVKRHRAKVVNAPPAALRMLLDANVPAESLSSLVALRAGTAPLDSAIVEGFLTRYNIPVLAQYGATEFAGAVAGWTIDMFRSHYPAKCGSVGRLQPNIEGRVVDADSGRILPPTEIGVLELRGPQVENSGRWVRTTDRACIDSDGFLFIHGRADHAINRGGFKIHPDEVVRAIEGHMSVREAVVVGLSDKRLGEVPAAMVTVHPGALEPSTEEMSQFLKARLLPYQIPVSITYVPDLPRTPMLKPNIPEVRRLLESALRRD